jgi:hypothetical protein
MKFTDHLAGGDRGNTPVGDEATAHRNQETDRPDGIQDFRVFVSVIGLAAGSQNQSEIGRLLFHGAKEGPGGGPSSQ